MKKVFRQALILVLVLTFMFSTVSPALAVYDGESGIERNENGNEVEKVDGSYNADFEDSGSEQRLEDDANDLIITDNHGDELSGGNVESSISEAAFSEDNLIELQEFNSDSLEVSEVTVSNFTQLHDAVNTFNSGSVNKIVNISANIDIESVLTISNSLGAVLTIRGNNAEAPQYVLQNTPPLRVGEDNIGLFDIESGTELVIENIVIDGYKTEFWGYYSPLVSIRNGGRFTMNAGAILRTSARGVDVLGIFVMNGGEIRDNDRGVFVRGSGSFTMNDGNICNNGSGVSVSDSGSFTMNGGNIYNTGLGVFVDGGGTFILDGGRISDNTDTWGFDGGVFVQNNSTFTMHEGEISGNSGSGVRVQSNSTFTMHEGEISGNSGSGVHVQNDSTFTMHGGEISGNAAPSGAGVFVQESIFVMSGGKISNNTGTWSGGVYVQNRGTFAMSGGIISDNIGSGVTAGGSRNNINYIFGGTAIIRDNMSASGIKNNVQIGDFRGSWHNITLGTGENGNGVPVPQQGMEIWVTAGRRDGRIVDSGATKAHMSYFHSDEDKRIVAYEDGMLLIGALALNAEDFLSHIADSGLIYIGANITLDEMVEISFGHTLTLKSINNAPKAFTISRGFAYTQTDNSVFFLRNTGTHLILENIVIDGEKDTFAGAGGLVTIGTNSGLTMNSNAALQNNSGSGVIVSGGRFVMNGGNISGNSATSGGGVDLQSGTFAMSGGEISGNTASERGGGISYQVLNTNALIFGGTAVIRDNMRDDEKNNVDISVPGTGNVAAHIVLGTGTAGNGVSIPRQGMEVWVTAQSSNIRIVESGATAVHTGFFHSDKSKMAVSHENGMLFIRDIVYTSEELLSHIDMYNTSSGDRVIFIGDNITLTRSVLLQPSIGGVRTLTIRSVNSAPEPFVIRRGFEYTYTFSQDTMFFLMSGGSGRVAHLILENIVIDGAGDILFSHPGSIVTIRGDCSLVINDNVYLQNNIGRGVLVEFGTFTMNGGEISGNRGSNFGGMSGDGVIISNGTFTMNGGEISGNVRGVTISSNSIFTMNDGEISNNMMSGGVSVSAGTFTMNGGIISGNIASSGGGVTMFGNSTFTMSGGEISNNTSDGRGSVDFSGGGVYVQGTFTMSGGTISNNTSSGSSSQNAGGGGVRVSGTFIMSGGEITENTAGIGGGVYVETSGTLIMSGGEITENTASDGAGGVSVGRSFTTVNGDFTVGGTAVIRDNEGSGNNLNNVRLWGGFITLGTGVGGNGVPIPAEGMEIWVSTRRDDGVIVFSGALETHAEFFYPDEDDKMIHFDNGRLIILEHPFVFEFYALVESFATASSDMAIELPVSITLYEALIIPANQDGHTLTIRSADGADAPYTLRRGFFTRFNQPSDNNGVIVVSDGAHLILEDIILDGNRDRFTPTPTFSPSLVHVGNGGILVINDGAILQNNHANRGGGVSVSAGTFTMNGGEIRGNLAGMGGGVDVRGRIGIDVGLFIMNGGSINNNTATTWYGGGVSISDSTMGLFRMNGGEIVNNTAELTGGGVDARGGSPGLGGTAIIRDNFLNDGFPNNVHLNSGTDWSPNDRFIVLGTGASGNGIAVPSEGMEVWVTTDVSTGVIVTANATEAHLQYIHADDSSMVVVHENGRLIIRNPPAPQPTLTDLNFNLSTVVYSGTQRSVNVTAASGVVGLGNITVLYNGSTTPPVNAGTYSVSVNIAQGANFSAINGLSLGQFTIGQRSLTISGVTAVDRPFDGGNTVTITGGTLQNTVSGNNVTANIPATGTVSNPNVENSKPVTIGEITLSGTAAANYTLTQPTGITVNISRRQLTNATITLEPAPFIFTDSAVRPAVTSVIVDGITVPPTNYTTAYTNNVGAGTATVTITARGDSNFTGSASTTFEIVKATATGVTTQIPNVHLTASQTSGTGSGQAVVDRALNLGRLPSEVEVNLNNNPALTYTKNVEWVVHSGYSFNPQGSVYTAIGTLADSDNVVIYENKAPITVVITVTAVEAANPTFAGTTVPVNPTGGSVNAATLGNSILPTSGSILAGGTSVSYTIVWDSSQTLDVTAIGNSTVFTGTITYDPSATWLTVPDDATVTRTVSVATAQTPTFTLSAAPTAPDFGSRSVGYAGIPAQTVTVTNTGTGSITLGALPSVQGWNLVAGANWSAPIAAGQSRDFTISPNNGLALGTYSPVITITAVGGPAVLSIQVQPMFTVTPMPLTPMMGAFVTRLYQHVLQRSPDAAGLAHWTNQLRNGTTGASVAYEFFFSREFLSRNLSSDRFIDILYLALLDRSADAGGRAFWMNQLNAGVPREEILAGFIVSNEFTRLCNDFGIVRGTITTTPGGQSRVLFVTRFYRNVLGREPDQTGLHHWVSGLTSGTTGATIAHQFFFSNEFLSQRVSNERYLELLYLTLLNRSSTASDRAYWLTQLNIGVPRENVLAGFVVSTEFTNLCNQFGIVRGTYTPPSGGSERAFVVRLYREMLLREPSQAEAAYWVSQLENGASGTEVARGFVTSTEITNRNLSNVQYVETLYRALIGRPSDANGLAYWVNQLNSGVSRGAVFNGFAASHEFGNICRMLGIQR